MDNYTLVQYKTKTSKPGRRGHAALDAGSYVWLIQYKNKRYFCYSYTNQNAAVRIANLLTGTEREIEWNSVADPEKAQHSRDHSDEITALEGLNSDKRATKEKL